MLLAAVVLLAGARASRAEDHSGHSHHHSNGAAAAHPEKAKGKTMSSHDGMTALYAHIREIEKAFASGDMAGIHDHAEDMGTAMKDLDKDSTLTPEKKKRVQGYVKNVGRLAHKLHDFADANKADQAKREFGKLKAQVDLLDRQFAHSHKPGAEIPPKEGAAHHEK